MSRILSIPLALQTGDRADKVPWGEDEEVPDWALDRDAKQYAIKDEWRKNGCILCNYSGPAARLLWTAFRWTWGFWMLTPVISFVVIYIFGEHGGQGLPRDPPLLVPACLLALLPLLVLEHRVRAILMVPIARLLTTKKKMRILGFPVSFTTWLLYQSAVSMASHMDVIFNGIFSARVFLSYFLGGPMMAAWTAEQQKSLFISSVSLPFFVYVLVAWLMMSLQAMYVMVSVVPRTGLTTWGWKIVYEYGEFPVYATLVDTDSDHLVAITSLLDVNRLASLIMPWFDAACKEDMCTAFGRFQVPGRYNERLQAVLVKFGLFSCFESAFFANLQVLVLGLAKAASNGRLDGNTTASIIISILMGIYTLRVEYAKVKHLTDAISSTNIEEEFIAIGRERNEPDELIERNLGDLRTGARCDDFSEWFAEGKQAQAVVKRKFRIFQAMCLLYVLFLGRAFFQLLGVMWCATGLYNMGVGCIEL